MESTSAKQNKVNRDSLVGHMLHDGAYSVQRVLGHGGMGNVYLALHNTLKIPLALKQAHADQPLPESVIEELDTLLSRNPISMGSEDPQSDKLTHDQHF